MRPSSRACVRSLWKENWISLFGSSDKNRAASLGYSRSPVCAETQADHAAAACTQLERLRTVLQRTQDLPCTVCKFFAEPGQSQCFVRSFQTAGHLIPVKLADRMAQTGLGNAEMLSRFCIMPCFGQLQK